MYLGRPAKATVASRPRGVGFTRSSMDRFCRETGRPVDASSAARDVFAEVDHDSTGQGQRFARNSQPTVSR